MSNLPKHALSVRQPYAHHIIYGSKDVENRTWSTSFRGPVLIHASSTPYRGELAYIRENQLPMGGFIGMVEVVDCVSEHESGWFNGPVGFVLANPQPLPFLPCKGRQGFFRLEEDLRQQLEKLWRAAA